jgi:hypothetical protein
VLPGYKFVLTAGTEKNPGCKPLLLFRSEKISYSNYEIICSALRRRRHWRNSLGWSAAARRATPGIGDAQFNKPRGASDLKIVTQNRNKSSKVWRKNPHVIHTLESFLASGIHHPYRKKTFQEEYIELLNENRIEFDDKYLW